jgi:hypothetical protein
MGLVLSVLNGVGIQILHVMGFGSAGVTAGSIAVACGLFALAQSAGMTGAGTIATTTGGAVMGLLGGLVWVAKRIVRL